MDSGKKTINHVEIRKILPVQDGYRMPGEYEPHRGCILIWPERPGSWRNGAREAKKAFADVIRAIAKSEEVYLAASGKTFSEAEKLAQRLQTDEALYPIRVFTAETDDAWARDVGPTFVKNARKEVRGISWQFNAWGGEVDGLYASWEKDDAAAEAVCDALGYPVYDAGDFVLEGGSIHSDGEGTLLVTEACLLSPGRNPRLTKEEIEKKLCEYLGAKKVIWLKNGIWQDETNEHVDNVCAFVKPGEVVLAWTDDKEDPQYALSMEDYQILENETDAKGRKFVIHKLPIPEKPVCIQEEDLKGLAFEPGEDIREAGERLAASYVNFYIANEVVLVPQFQDKHDKLACDILGKLFPERKICPIDAQAIIIGGGNIHCITQQIPSGCGK